MSGTASAEAVEKDVRALVSTKALDEWAQRMASNLLSSALPGDIVELELSVDFSNAPKTLSNDEKQQLMNRLALLR